MRENVEAGNSHCRSASNVIQKRRKADGKEEQHLSEGLTLGMQGTSRKDGKNYILNSAINVRPEKKKNELMRYS